MPPATPPRIDSGRLWSDLMTLAAIGALPAGGCDRLALTEADGAARNLLGHWFAQAGLAVSVDAIGNMFGRREGTDPALPPVLVGSHLDTQSPGGKFDGPLGVLAALECVRTLDRAGLRTKRAIEVVNWTNEEGARFAPGLMGSAVFTGVLDLAAAQAAQDRNGLTVRDALDRIRYRGAVQPGGRPVDSYFELHIEQGDRLQTAGCTIGVVTGSEFNCFAFIDCFGANGHAQATPMPQRGERAGRGVRTGDRHRAHRHRARAHRLGRRSGDGGLAEQPHQHPAPRPVQLRRHASRSRRHGRDP